MYLKTVFQKFANPLLVGIFGAVSDKIGNTKHCVNIFPFSLFALYQLSIVEGLKDYLDEDEDGDLEHRYGNRTPLPRDCHYCIW